MSTVRRKMADELDARAAVPGSEPAFVMVRCAIEA
jgi:hypothetical protein